MSEDLRNAVAAAIFEAMQRPAGSLPAADAAIAICMEHAAKVAEGSWVPSYVRFDDGEWTPGSPYDRGAVDSCERIARSIRALATPARLTTGDPA